MFRIPDNFEKQWKTEGKRFHLEILKVADFRKDFEELSKIGEHAQDLVLEPDQMSCLHTDDMKHRTIYLKFNASFFEVYHVRGRYVITILLSDWVSKLNKCNLEQHIRRLIVKDTEEGYIHLYGLNQNGILASEYIHPFTPTSTSTLSPSSSMTPTTICYDHVIEIPAKLFQIEVNAHCKTGAQWLTFILNPHAQPAYLTFSSMVKQGLGGFSSPSFLLPPENIICAKTTNDKTKDDSQAKKLTQAEVTVNLQYLKLHTNSHAYKQCLIVRLYLANHAPLVLEFLSMQSRQKRSQDSVLQVWIGQRIETTLHPSVIP